MCPRIPQKLRISGTLTAILLVFLLTAILVKVEMAPLTFFTITMIKIICINCEFLFKRRTPPAPRNSTISNGF